MTGSREQPIPYSIPMNSNLEDIPGMSTAATTPLPDAPLAPPEMEWLRPPRKKAVLIGIAYNTAIEQDRLGPHSDCKEFKELLIGEDPPYLDEIPAT
jgi:hypothetical protein